MAAVVDRDLFAQSAGAAAVQVIDLGTPGAGVRWKVNRVAAFGLAAPQTAIAGSVAFVCVGGSTVATFDPTTIALVIGPLPDSDNFGGVQVDQGERLSVWVFGAAAAVVAATAGVTEVPS
jgi:hypothetical protein